MKGASWEGSAERVSNRVAVEARVWWAGTPWTVWTVPRDYTGSMSSEDGGRVFGVTIVGRGLRMALGHSGVSLLEQALAQGQSC